MAKIEAVYRDNKNERIAVSYSIDSVYWLSVLLKIAGIVVLAAGIPAIIAGTMFLLDSPTKPILGTVMLLGGVVGSVVGYYFFYGLANTVCLLLDLKGSLDRNDAKE